MTGTPVRDDNLRLVLAPVEKKQIDEMRRRAWSKFLIGIAFAGAAAASIAIVFVMERYAFSDLPALVQLLVLLLIPVGLLGSPMALISAAMDAVKAAQYRDDFEAFQRSYGRDPDAVQTPKSWTVE